MPDESSVGIEDIGILGDIISDTADKQTKLEEKAIDDGKKEHDAEIGKLQRESFAQDISERKKYADKIYRLIAVWLVCIGGVIVLQGFLSKYGVFNLSDKVLIALITGTTINVLGLFAIVVNYLFKNK